MTDLPLMSIKEARKLLGKEAQHMNDDQVLNVIIYLTEVAKAHVHTINIKKSKQRK